MAKGLTHIAIQKLKPRGYQYEEADSNGLRVTVFPSGKKSFVVRYRYRGLQRKLTLGPVSPVEPDGAPVLGAPQSLASARVLATQALQDAARGIDWTQKKRQEREAEHAAEADTLQAVAEEYLRREGDKLRSLDQRRSDLELAYPTLGRLPIEGIRRGQYVRLLDQIADDRGPVRADRVLTALKTLLGWHAGRGEYVNVLGREVKRRTSTKDRARSRVLLDDELQKLWLAAEQGGVFGAYVRFLMLTATRRNEALGLRRSELSKDGATWIIPAARYKQKKDTLIPLSAAAQAIITAQPNIGDLVFSKSGLNELGGLQWRKEQLDTAAGVTGWTLHDLRRTARTLLSRAGINADVAERCLGHAIRGVRATYDRFEYAGREARRLRSSGGLVERLVRPPEVDVADFAAAREKRKAQ